MFDEEWDPDDDESRARMAAALEEEDDDAAVRPMASVTLLPTDEEEHLSQLMTLAADALRAHAPHGHSSVLHGAPSLQVSDSHGLAMQRELSEEEVEADASARLTVEVDWGSSSDCGHAYTLSLHRPNDNIDPSSATGRHGQQLHASLPAADPQAAAQPLLASLTWPGGSRHLHVPPLVPRGRLNLGSLLSVGGGPLPTSDALLAPACGRDCSELGHLPDRGWAIELEVITMAADPDVSGYFTKAEEWTGNLARIEASLADARAADSSAAQEPLRARLRRCAQFEVTRDAHIMPSPRSIGQRMVEAAQRAGELPASRGDAGTAEVRKGGDIDGGASEGAGRDATGFLDAENAAERALTMCMGERGTVKTEFKSPAPPHELNFAHGGGDEVATFVRVVRWSGAAATSLSALGHSGSSIHIHVNVASPDAAGGLLSSQEVLRVFLQWVVYDGVTARMARPWMWREPSMAPLYATGAEFGWTESAWEQGRFVGAAARPTYDVPTFVAAVRTVRSCPGFDDLPTATQLERLFGEAHSLRTPGAALGRYTSLNLNRITKYGTLEFRRQHATLDADAVCRWAHFCVCFVEAFRRPSPLVDVILDGPLEVGLDELRRAQATATLAKLASELEGFVSPDALAALVHEGSGGAESACSF